MALAARTAAHRPPTPRRRCGTCPPPPPPPPPPSPHPPQPPHTPLRMHASTTHFCTYQNALHLRVPSNSTGIYQSACERARRRVFTLALAGGGRGGRRRGH